MKSVSGKEFVKVLDRNGWVLLRIQSSHHIYGKQGSNVRLSIPIHANQTMKMGLLEHMMRLAGSRKMTFESKPRLNNGIEPSPEAARVFEAAPAVD